MFRNALIALAVAALAVIGATDTHADLIANGNFATGDFTAWSPTAGAFIDSSNPNPPDAYDAALPNGEGLSQGALSTVGGQSYVLKFAVLDDLGIPLDALSVTLGNFNDTVLGSEAAGSYFGYSATVPGGDIFGADTLSFGSTTLAGDWHLDDVSLNPVTATVPEPGSLFLLASGLVGLLALRRLRSGDG